MHILVPLIIGASAVAVITGILVPGQPQSMILSACGSVLWAILLIEIRGRP